jgi:hypothetical protein
MLHKNDMKGISLGDFTVMIWEGKRKKKYMLSMMCKLSAGGKFCDEHGNIVNQSLLRGTVG